MSNIDCHPAEPEAGADARVIIQTVVVRVCEADIRMPYRRSAGFEDAARTFAVAGPELG
jgi:hypothetical protein